MNLNEYMKNNRHPSHGDMVMSLHKIEFRVGQEVTYFPYEEEVRRTVVGIKPHQNIWGKPDDRVWYLLTNTRTKGNSVVTECTGLCIKESIYFEEHGGIADA